ncbi:hypothetical protein C8R46DRAFT_946043 [Mycena filopes]|nr:hypothetical protein C8R46DRAFT_946043 [Mycena filopes]
MPTAIHFDPRYDVRDESASAKLWGVYLSEAEKYDHALVESWRSDMQGMLIFAGLFSASLTAFIVESYKTLLPDSGDSTVVLLTQISLQLAAAANGTAFTIPAPIPFSPATSNVVCNALWFISLGFSLTCALIATLLEQWARDYLHKADMHSAPVVRARIFAYLFHGLKRFKLHVVVELVPLLLHLSLVFFFAGLVAFLFPVDRLLVTITACILGLTLAIYSCLTVLPIIWPDCPYRTPLSSGLLSLLQSVVVVTKQFYFNTPYASALSALSARWRMSDLIAQRAIQTSQARNLRDRRALIWTCRSLSDDASIELFLEGILHVLDAPRIDRTTYSAHIREMVHIPNASLSTHIAGLLLSCESGVLVNGVKERRQLVCLKAIWAIALMSTPQNPLLHHILSMPSQSSLAHYAVSARALLGRSILHSINDDILGTLTSISQCQIDVQAGKEPDLSPILYAANRILRERSRLGIAGRELLFQSVPSSAWLQDTRDNLELFLDLGGWFVYSDYICRAAMLDGLPYHYHDTVSAFDFRPAMASPRITFSLYINATVNAICADHLDALSGETETHHVDEILVTLAGLWSRARAQTTVLPHGMLKYLSCRTSMEAVLKVMYAAGVKGVWQGILNHKHSSDFTTKPSRDFGEALWRVTALRGTPVAREHLEEALLILRGLPDSAAKPSALALVHARLLVTLTVAMEQQATPTLTELATMLAHPALPADDESRFPVPTPIRLDGSDPTAVPLLRECVDGKVKEAYIRLLGDFFHSCGLSTAPHEALETLVCIRSLKYFGFQRHGLGVHPAHQLRFAEGLQAMFANCKNIALLGEAMSLPLFPPPQARFRNNNPALLRVEETVSLPMFPLPFTVTPPSPPSSDNSSDNSEQPLRYLHWLDILSARRTVKDVLAAFRIPSSSSPALGERWSNIMCWLEESADAGSSGDSSPSAGA